MWRALNSEISGDIKVNNDLSTDNTYFKFTIRLTIAASSRVEKLEVQMVLPEL